MKPIIIYAMPRSRSTAILHSAKRANYFHEPFNRHRIREQHGVYSVVECQKILTDFYYREQILPHLLQSDVAIKILAAEIHWFTEARQWFSDVQINNHHEIYIVVRDLRETLWSLLLAPHYGFFTHDENPETLDKMCEVSLAQIENTIEHLVTFLHYMPKTGHLISWDHLPSKDFDRNITTIKNQNSLNRKSLIKNHDYCENHIEEIVKIYQTQWEDKLLSKPWAPL